MKYLIAYFKKRSFVLLLIGSVCIFYHLYFLCLVTLEQPEDLFYLDFLIFVFLVCVGVWDFLRFKKLRRNLDFLLSQDTVIWQPDFSFEYADLLEHDARIYQQQYQDLYEAHCDLQDYFTKWCHEVKLPLSAARLMQERISNPVLRADMKLQLEKINQYLNTALVGCKIQSHLYDLQMKRVNLADCVRTSIHNQQFFLIQKHFELDIEYNDLSVYTDKEWLVYILDQLISNAVKYTEGPPLLKIRMFSEGQRILLTVEDHGEGIQPADIRRIFDKGYTGQNHHNGRYRSTGMGLYMTAQMIEKLGHRIQAESEPGIYTRFTITFSDSRDYFYLT